MPATATRTLRILIVDDQDEFVATLAALLEDDESLDVVGSARDGAQAVALVEVLEPDVVLMDIQMPKMDGFEAARQILERDPSMRIVMVTGSDTPATAERARGLGQGYVAKSKIFEELLDAIRA